MAFACARMCRPAPSKPSPTMPDELEAEVPAEDGRRHLTAPMNLTEPPVSTLAAISVAKPVGDGTYP